MSLGEHALFSSSRRFTGLKAWFREPQVLRRAQVSELWDMETDTWDWKAAFISILCRRFQGSFHLDEKQQQQTNSLYIPRCHEGLKSFPVKSFKYLSVTRWWRLCSETPTEQNREPSPGKKSLGESSSSPPMSTSPCVPVTRKPLQRLVAYTDRHLLILCAPGVGTPKTGPLNDWSHLWPVQPWPDTWGCFSY